MAKQITILGKIKKEMGWDNNTHGMQCSKILWASQDPQARHLP